MTRPDTRPFEAQRRLFLQRTSQWLLAGASLAPGSRALAGHSDPRYLAFDHTHTRESLTLVYALGDDVLPPAHTRLNHFLRDHYSGEVGTMDPRLFHLLHRVQRALGVSQAFEVISGYRSAATNAHLRHTRGGGVASRSLHMDGQAIDVRLPGVALADLRDVARQLAMGGVGYYPREQFVHLDTGRVRHWGN